MRLIISSIVFLSIVSQLLGQEQLAESRPKFIIKNGTTSLLDPIIPTFNVGIEGYLTENLSLYLEGGPTLKYRYFFNEPTINKLDGYKLRAALRYYFDPPTIGNPAFYIELYGSYYRIDANIQGDFGRTTSTGFYQQRLNYDMDRVRSGVYANIGIQAIDSNRFVIEIGTGLGMIKRKNIYGGVPDDARFFTNGGNIFQYSRFGRDDDWVGMVFFYINLGYAAGTKN